MTREQWMESIDDIDDLMAFCYHEDCPVLDDVVYSDEAMDDYINEFQLVDWAQNNTWYQLKDLLSNLPGGENWYKKDEYGDWLYIDAYDLLDFIEGVADWCEENGYFDEEEEEEPAEPEPAPEPEVPNEVFESDLFLSELMFDAEQAFSAAEQVRLEAQRILRANRAAAAAELAAERAIAAMQAEQARQRAEQEHQQVLQELNVLLAAC